MPDQPLPLPPDPNEEEQPPKRIGDIIRDMQEANELPNSTPHPQTPRSPIPRPALPPRPISTSTSSCPICASTGIFATSPARTRDERLICIATYGEQRAVAICPACPAGAARAAAWSGLDQEARSIRLSGRFRDVPEQRLAVQAVAAFIADPRGWLTLAGDYGVGKTMLICATLNHLADVGVYGRYLTAPDLIASLRDSLRDVDGRAHSDRLARLFALPVLAIDELDKYYSTEYAEETIFRLFDARYRARSEVATLIGYNLSREERIPPFLRSRIGDGRFKLIRMHGPDLRPALGEL